MYFSCNSGRIGGTISCDILVCYMHIMFHEKGQKEKKTITQILKFINHKNQTEVVHGKFFIVLNLKILSCPIKKNQILLPEYASSYAFYI